MLGLAPASQAWREETKDAAAQETGAREPELYPSARDAMAAFLEGMAEVENFATDREQREHYLLQALDALELEGELESRATLAKQLLGVLDRTGPVNLGDLPGPLDPRTREESSATWLGTSVDVENLEVRIVLKRSKSFHWQISKRTMEQVPGWWEQLEDVDVAKAVVAERSADAAARSLPEWLRYRLQSVMPDAMRTRAFLLENWQWLGLVVLVLIGLILDRIVRFLLGRSAKRLARSERLEIPEGDLAGFERPFGIVVTALFVQSALPVLSIVDRHEGVILTATSFVLRRSCFWPPHTRCSHIDFHYITWC